MKRYFQTLLIAFFILGIALLVPADEGMWLPHQMKDLGLKAMGLQMDPEDLYKKDGTGLMSAVVSLGGGTGEFVSAEGLILTNHHVAFGAIQRAASKEKDYIRDGFLALNRAEEIPAQGYIADVLLGYEDITVPIAAKLKPGMTPRQRFEAIEQVQKALIAKAEKAGKDLRCTISAMYSGNFYYLFTFKRIRDVRLVYAPPFDLGNFGGEVDNWMWPRHTCDFSFLRAYVSKDNIGADFSSENVPYRPKSILKISLDGFKEGDLTFIMGYPGRTYRNNTLAEVQFDLESLKRRLELFKDVISYFERRGKDNKDVEIKYASLVKGLSNSLKNYQGKIEGMEKIDLAGKKQAQEKEFMEWVAQVPDRQGKYGDILTKIDQYIQKFAKDYWRNDILQGLISSAFSSTLLSQAYTITRTVDERQKADLERDPAYQERNIPFIKRTIQVAERGYDLATDREYFKYRLKMLLSMPNPQLPAALKNIAANPSSVDSFVDDLYNRTGLANPDKRLALLDFKPADLAKLNDPILNLAAALEKELKIVREEGKGGGQERLDLKKIYEAALLEKNSGKFSADANSTIRFTYGPVEGYSPKDAVYYRPQTTLRGVIEKETNQEPFKVPSKIKELYKAGDFGRYLDRRLKEVPACFLNTTNVTGGNSGSPTFNTRGEQIGIIFDMTWESVIGDYYIIPELQRSISVDIRYVLFVTDKFSGATHILKELGF
jgi:hypothetical protein